ncbi:hypothetical protein CH249_25175 [Rhodococcus sp. 05-2255-3B1]|uniref:hypothetical protein n=1 Tax=unclassified Rhodococcus (in: high G+C Gram-positive bacteria) TaxID=192944 RepID=UPI000B9AFE32|nr:MULTISPECIES: hypothetical protein [unclassified Rhodococcus (in: high G+C Gram-positive bacteria)]OZE05012.1 hypothetical protein CH249_25175 [Rhodococcus sp. 05-2255-3B1]OZE07230.1 hypothetical protein CH250_18820 [Rhodococcus sp. 05-2255-3C]OZE20285.1 hypothetical protein CH255_09870 [Rhodococcus sp. 05-2255-2A2]
MDTSPFATSVIVFVDRAYSGVMYIPGSLRCHDTSAGSLCAAKVDHRFGDSADLSAQWVFYTCSADSAHETGYVDRLVTA